uniref:Uncharacterized protein n=1 Tax=Wuchereria bancrofti TaxID=6293 RepID=A0A1I8EQV2_WUCBA
MRKHYCGKSSLPVYFVELVQVAGRSWHTHTVFVVVTNPKCGSFMDSRSYNDHKEQLYRNHCYKYLSGLKVSITVQECYLQSVVNAKIQIQMNEANWTVPYSILSLYTTNRKDGNAITSAADTCRRCSKEVYDAEKILAGGMVCLAAVSVLTDV